MHTEVNAGSSSCTGRPGAPFELPLGKEFVDFVSVLFRHGIGDVVPLLQLVREEPVLPFGVDGDHLSHGHCLDLVRRHPAFN